MLSLALFVDEVEFQREAACAEPAIMFRPPDHPGVLIRPAELVKKHAPTPAKRLREAARAKRALEKMGHVWQMPSSKESNAHFCRLGRFAEGASRTLAVRPTGLGRFAECASRTPVVLPSQHFTEGASRTLLIPPTWDTLRKALRAARCIVHICTSLWTTMAGHRFTARKVRVRSA